MTYPSFGRLGRISEPYKIELTQSKIRPLAGREVLVQIKASALCGSDLHTARGRHPSVPLPATVGHEFSGDVIAVGPESHHPHGSAKCRFRAVRSLRHVPGLSEGKI